MFLSNDKNIYFFLDIVSKIVYYKHINKFTSDKEGKGGSYERKV